MVAPIFDYLEQSLEVRLHGQAEGRTNLYASQRHQKVVVILLLRRGLIRDVLGIVTANLPYLVDQHGWIAKVPTLRSNLHHHKPPAGLSDDNSSPSLISFHGRKIQRFFQYTGIGR